MTSIINAELLAIFSIPLFASLMARGVWFQRDMPWQLGAAPVALALGGLGYKYVNLDAGWSLRDRDNATGRPQPDPTLFPNIANGGVAKHLHGMGFHFGIYSDSGTLNCGGGARRARARDRRFLEEPLE